MANAPSSPLGSLVLKAPAAWETVAPKSAMRRAEWRIPGTGGDASLVVYYFGPRGAGSADANLKRWYGQFEQPDGKATRDVARTSQDTVAGLPITRVDVSGTYLESTRPMGGKTTQRPGYRMLGAIITAKEGPYYLKLVGPAETVNDAKASFDRMLSSLRVSGRSPERR